MGCEYLINKKIVKGNTAIHKGIRFILHKAGPYNLHLFSVGENTDLVL